MSMSWHNAKDILLGIRHCQRENVEAPTQIGHYNSCRLSKNIQLINNQKIQISELKFLEREKKSTESPSF